MLFLSVLHTQKLSAIVFSDGFKMTHKMQLYIFTKTKFKICICYAIDIMHDIWKMCILKATL